VTPARGQGLRVQQLAGGGWSILYGPAMLLLMRSTMASRRVFLVFVISLFTRKKEAVGHRAVTAVFEMFDELR
jgi:hypothetical protein